MKTFARLTYAALPFDRTVRAHLVVGLEAPPLATGVERPPICVVPVVDVSGSMQGEKLRHAKLSLLKLVDHLGPRDRCGLVTFANDVRSIAAPEPLTPELRARLKLAIGDLEANGGTNLAGGMLEGLGLANAAAAASASIAAPPAELRTRVILFTDGCANQGLATTAAELLPLLAAHRGQATLSAFGYGPDADQELLSELARAGAGNYAFIAGPDDAAGAFARELGALLSTYADRLVIEVRPPAGARVVGVLSDVDADTTGGITRLQVDDLLAEEVRHLVLEVELAALPAPMDAQAFRVSGTFRLLEAGAARLAFFNETATVARVAPADAQRRPDPDLDVIVAQAELLDAQLRAEEVARRGDHDGAVQLLVVLAAGFEDRGHAGVAEAARRMARGVASETSWRASSSYRKSMRSGLRRAASSSLDASAEGDLRAMGKSFRTRAQEDMADSFARPEEPPRPSTPASPGRSRRPASPSGGPPGGEGGGEGGPVRRRRSRRW